MIHGLIGVVHLPPLPGDPRAEAAEACGAFSAAALAARQDAAAWAAGGATALIVENFGSAPFVKGTAGARLPPHQVAAMALIVQELVQRTALPVGVNCLRNDARAAIGIAAAAGADFVRVNVHVGAYLTDQGLIEGEAAETLRYRRAIGADRVAILADVLVKHAAPVAPIDAAAATAECLERGLADGVIVTGAATGAPVDLRRLREVRAAAGDRPVYVGSGVTPENAGQLAPLVDGAIVGTWCKRDGDVSHPVDEARVRQLAAVFGRERSVQI